MKKIVALLITVAVPLQAQSHITVLAGYSSSRVVADAGGEAPVAPVASVHGFVPGVGFTIPLSNRVGLTAELLYVAKGYSFAVLNPYTEKPQTVYRLGVRYAELPLLVTARYPFGKAEMVVLGGASLGVRIKCDATVTQEDGSQSGNDCVDTDRGTTVPATNVALTAGFGLAWHRWTLTGQYEMTGKALDAFPPGPSFQHRTLLLLLGFDLLKAKDR